MSDKKHCKQNKNSLQYNFIYFFFVLLGFSWFENTHTHKNNSLDGMLWTIFNSDRNEKEFSKNFVFFWKVIKRMSSSEIYVYVSTNY